MSTGTTDYSWPVVTKSMEAAVMSQLKESISIYDRSGSIAQLEDRFREYYGCKYAVATNAGTTALWSLYVGSGIGPGDEVICQTYTFFATASPIFFTGAVPVLTDCDESGNIDPREIARHITPRTKAIVVTHM